jgi:ATP-dependent Clp protease ATP-binding subunit ClpC
MTLATARPLTTRTRVSLAIARALAAARGESDVTPTHIVLGIFREGANPAIAALFSGGVDPAILQRVAPELEATLGEPHGRTDPRRVVLDLTPGEDIVLVRAEKEAEDFADEFIGTEHILLGILCDRDDPLAVFLAERGITAELLRRGIVASRSDHTR